MDRGLGWITVIVVAIAIGPRPPPACAQACERREGCIPRLKMCGTMTTTKDGRPGCVKHCCYDPDSDDDYAAASCCIGLGEDGRTGDGWCCPRYHRCGATDRTGKPIGQLCVCEGPFVDGRCQCSSDRKCGPHCCKDGEECIRGECKPWCKNETARGTSRVYDPATQCCAEYGIEQKYPIRNFARCEKTRVPRPGFTPTANGCGTKEHKVLDEFVPEHGKPASFLAACNAHDLCYGTCGKKKQACDDAFEKAVKKACTDAYKRGANRDACLRMATKYTDGARVLGSLFDAYDEAQNEACQCCP